MLKQQLKKGVECARREKRLLRRKGWAVNHRHVRRLHRLEGQQVRRATSRPKRGSRWI